MSSRIIRAASPESRKITPFHIEVEGGSPEAPPTAGLPKTVLSPVAVKETPPEIDKESYDKGFAEGCKEGQTIGENRFDSLTAELGKTLDELRLLRRSVLVTSEREVIRLALEIARKIVRREIAIDDEVILALVRVALSRIADHTLVTVRVNPKDAAVLQRHQANGPDGIKLIEDPLIARGGCLIETESGTVDARIEEQLREIERGFLE